MILSNLLILLILWFYCFDSVNSMDCLYAKHAVKLFVKGDFYRRIGWDLKPITRAWL